MSEGHSERIDPLEVPPGILAHHLKKYEFAYRWASGLTLDIACGVGYGTEYLTRAGARVVGIEIDQEALRVASNRYASTRTLFVGGDAQRLPFRDACADVAVCFEGIEHFADPHAHVAEVARVLKSEGVFLVSTPRPQGETHAPDNPFHVREFDLDHLRGLLQAWFDDITVLGQRRIQTTPHRTLQRADVFGLRRVAALRPLARSVSRLLRTAPVEKAKLSDFQIDDQLTEATEYVAICGGPRA